MLSREGCIRYLGFDIDLTPDFKAVSDTEQSVDALIRGLRKSLQRASSKNPVDRERSLAKVIPFQYDNLVPVVEVMRRPASNNAVPGFIALFWVFGAVSRVHVSDFLYYSDLKAKLVKEWRAWYHDRKAEGEGQWTTIWTSSYNRSKETHNAYFRRDKPGLVQLEEVKASMF